MIPKFDQLIVDGLIEGGNTSIDGNLTDHFLTSSIMWNTIILLNRREPTPRGHKTCPQVDRKSHWRLKRMRKTNFNVMHINRKFI